MLNGKSKNTVLKIRLTLICAMLAASSAVCATDTPNLRGQWIGNSLLEGQHAKAKTSLTLGAADDENATMHIEDRNDCTLKGGKYATQSGADGVPAWSLSFKEARGGEVCQRLAKADFSLRLGSRPRTLEFDVTYPAADGTQHHRIGVMGRYP